ncbi:hypothetical protein [Streptomyces griseocarneus]|uniref:hypothetical protein n=1 Tax=Streptomyces griseocarneus TaxID=51201 RepID=UPI00167EF5E8|nr:hypothetical protein [Streptomyces griseocarneus]MBZ6478113.1 hypothetical protein [Streptomyces griseocarneus]GHG83667.1 hypothetical protein GCM10018779_66870 [Streptomyces griseocarneus]
MIANIWSGVAERLSERTAALLMSPAFGFWPLGAACSIISGQATLAGWVHRATRLSSVAQLLGLAVILLLVAASGVMAQQLTPAVLRLLQGDLLQANRLWPLAPARRRLTARHRRRWEALNDRWQKLMRRREVFNTRESGGENPLSPEEKGELREVEDELPDAEHRLAAYPTHPGHLLPTRLGNILRAGETKVRDKYGLDAVHCWPTLWLLLPEQTRQEVGAARTALDTAAAWWLWAALLAVWAPISPWVLLVAAAGIVLAYSSLLTRAAHYTELLVATFDVHRALLYDLYDCATWARPGLGTDERAWGEALTAALWRGPSEAPSPKQITGGSNRPS